MTEDFELTLFDRKEVIRKIIKEYGEERFYLSFSGGKDSTMLSVLLDEALPDNKIPRVFINTGIEFRAIVEFVHEKMKNDSRFIEIKPSKPIKAVLEEKGYPFKSKEHSNIVALANNGSHASSVEAYFDRTDTRRLLHCPLLLEYQKDNPPFKISSQCCTELKKKPAHEYEKKTGRIAILALREREKGQRGNHKGCVLKDDKGRIKKFKPVNPVSDEFEEWYIKSRNIKLCELYYPPYNFKRTGCKGCPYNIDLQEELDMLERYLPSEYKQCEYIWKPVYDEYRRLNYRLKKDKQLKLF